MKVMDIFVICALLLVSILWNPFTIAAAQDTKEIASCKDRCVESYFPGKPCYCNEACIQYENCCYDYVALCNPKLATNDSAVYFQGHFYKYTQDGTSTAISAAESCKQMGALLLSVNTKEEFEFIESVVLRGRTLSAFIGGTDKHSEGEWQWSDGTVMPLPRDPWHLWFPGEPDNNRGTEHCSVITNYEYWVLRKMMLDNYFWRDYSCDFNIGNEIQGYICEGTSQCEPNPCQNGGSCMYTGLTPEFECLCHKDFVGDVCQYQVKEGELWEICGETNLTSSEGTITSPLYPKQYPPNVRCQWYITAQLGSTVAIRIEDVSIESVKHCMFDSLTIYDDHHTNGSMALFGPFCGTAVENTMLTTSSNKALITFNSDKDIGNTGFKLHYSQSVCGQGTGSSGCGTRNMFTSKCGELAVIGGDGITDKQCEWFILLNIDHHINITFTQFNLSDTGDSCSGGGLEIYDGPDVSSRMIGRYCGHRAPFTVYSSTPQLHLRLANTQLLRASQGFNFNYQTYNSSKFKMFNNTNKVYGTTGVLKIVDNYLHSKIGSQVIYRWHIIVPHGLHLDVNWNIRPGDEVHIKIFKGISQFVLLDDIYRPSINSQEGNITIEYFQAVVEMTVSQSSIPEFNGFFNAAEWKTDLSNCFRPLFYDNASSSATENNLISGLQPVIVQLSNSDKYQGGQYCKWLIRGENPTPLSIDIIEANVYPLAENCSYDGLVIYDGPNVSYPIIGPFCGSSSLVGKSIVTTQSELLVVFYSDPYFGDRVNGNLRALIHQEPQECPIWMMGEPSTETNMASCGTILSPNFPGLVQKGLWFWQFTAPEGHYISLQVYFVRGPGIVDTTCQQSLKVLEVPKDSTSLRMYEKTLLKLCGDTEIFIPAKVLKVPPHQKMSIELNTLSNVLPQKWQFKMSFTTHVMAKPKNYPVTGLCPNEYIEWRGHCYKYYQWVRRHYVPEDYPWQLTWHNAMQYCQSQNATLLTIYDEDEAYFIKYTLSNQWFWDPASPVTVNHRLIYLGLNNKGSDYKWVDGIQLSYADWYMPRPDWSQTIFYPDSVLPEILNPQVPEPSAGVGSLCTGILPISPFESLNWVKIPCDYPIYRAGTICKKAKVDTSGGFMEEPAIHQPSNFNYQGSYQVCPDGYFMINNECLTLLTNYVQQTTKNSTIHIEPFTTISDAVETCENHGGMALLSTDVALHLEKYLMIWNHSVVNGDILLAVDNTTNICQALQITSENDNIIYHEVTLPCDKPHLTKLQLSSVLCSISVAGTVKEKCGAHEFVCLNRECISVDSVCDTVSDCRDQSDELNCGCDKTRFQCANNKCISLSLRCDFVDHCGDMSDELDCVPKKCDENEFQCNNRHCIPYEHICDFKFHCLDGSDEDQDLCSGLCKGFQCYSGRCLNGTLQNDGISDCPGLLFEDEIYEPADTSTFLEKDTVTYKKVKHELSYGCGEGPEYIKCHPEETWCYKRSEACMYDTVMMDDVNKLQVQTSCRDGYHLRTNCGSMECPGMYQCPGSYCIPVRKVCDGNLDCPLGQDEANCHNYSCPGLFKCKFSDICIPHSEVCDGVHNCGAAQEDEKYCGAIDPICDTCHCVGYIAYCENKNITTLPESHTTGRLLRAIFLDYNGLQITVTTFKDLHWLHKLSIRNNSLSKLQIGAFQSLVNLQHLDLSRNALSVVDYHIFTGLDNLKKLDLSHNLLTTFQQDSFSRLVSLDHLLIENNPLLTAVHPDSLMQLPELRILNSDAYKFCCIAKQVDICTPAADAFSNCEDLMANYPLQISIWILGVIATVGNLFVVIWRVITDMNKVSSMFIINLGCSDMLMGVYLLIIGGVDMYYRGSYIVHADNWRSSTLCEIAGVLAMVSSEVSVFMLTAITVDRCMAILFPLKFGQFRMKHARAVVVTGWLVCLFLSVLPATKTNYFGDAFFGRTGVCLPFQVSSEKLPGWEYSVFIFLILNLTSFIAIFVCYAAIFISVQSSIKSLGANVTKSADEYSLAKKLALIVATDFCCWVPIILIGFAALGGATISPQVSAWVAVFILPLNSAVNPLLYTISAIDCKKKKKTNGPSYSSNTGYTDVSETRKSIRPKAQMSAKEETCESKQISLVMDANSDSTKL